MRRVAGVSNHFPQGFTGAMGLPGWTLPRRGAPSQATSVQRAQPAALCRDAQAPHTCSGTLPRPVQRRMLRAEDLRSDPEQLLAKTFFNCLQRASQRLLPVYPC